MRSAAAAARRDVMSRRAAIEPGGGGGGDQPAAHPFLAQHQTIIAVMTGTLFTLVIFLLVFILYLIRNRYYKPVATDEEKRGISPGSAHGHAQFNIQSHGALGVGGAIKPKMYGDIPSPANSNIGHLARPPSLRSVQSIKDRRKFSDASSLTLSIQSSANSTSSKISKLAADRKNGAGVAAGIREAATTPSSQSARDHEVLRKQSRPLSEFSLRKIVHSLGTLSGEFMSLPMNHPESIDVCGVAKKNRHTSILPNNHSRIRLCGSRYISPVDGYINANYVRGYKTDAAFIAAQGPLPGTVDDFWWMIWQEKVSVIVMVTKVRERNKLMCEKYWPIKYSTYGDIMVTCEYSVNKDGYTVHGYLIAELQSASQRRVEQYIYSDWPDKEVPPSGRVLFSIMHEIKRQRRHEESSDGGGGNGGGPVLVHCSAGVGRTGCYIALNIAIEQYLADKTIDILGTVARIRLDRGGLVQTLEQYEFIHKALVQYIDRCAVAAAEPAPAAAADLKTPTNEQPPGEFPPPPPKREEEDSEGGIRFTIEQPG